MAIKAVIATIAFFVVLATNINAQTGTTGGGTKGNGPTAATGYGRMHTTHGIDGSTGTAGHEYIGTQGTSGGWNDGPKASTGAIGKTGATGKKKASGK